MASRSRASPPGRTRSARARCGLPRSIGPPPRFRRVKAEGGFCAEILQVATCVEGRTADAFVRAAGGTVAAARLGWFSLALCRETPPLHVVPELLRHLGRADPRGTQQRFEAVPAAPKTYCVSSERLLAFPRLCHC